MKFEVVDKLAVLVSSGTIFTDTSIMSIHTAKTKIVLTISPVHILSVHDAKCEAKTYVGYSPN